MLNRVDIAKELDIEIALNDDMANAINLWSNMYNNAPPWISKKVMTLGLPGAISNELARLVTIEFKSEIINNEYLNKIYQEFISVLRINTEYACAKGGLIFKPYFDGENIEVDIIQQDSFLPISYNAVGEITAAVFLEYKIIGDKKYTRLEYHDFKEDNYTIKNIAYVKSNLVKDNSLGKRTILASVPEWSKLQEEITLNKAIRPLFSYFKIPQANVIDVNSPLGVSCYSKAIDLIKEADKQFSRIIWEYEGTELAVNASESLFDKNKDGSPKFPDGNERLFRVFNWEERNGNLLLDTFSPGIRDENLFNGLNNILRRIEFNCGLAYGTLSDINDVSKTATEIKTSKQRSYSTVKDIQKSLEKALKGLILSMNDLVTLYKLNINNLDIDKDVSFEWDDSLILDKDSELESMRNDVSAGILRPELYLAKKYGVSEEEALKMMPEIEPIEKSPFNGLDE
ncbi:bacteriophage portal protein, SPP1 Gp6-like protein,phage portal protein, putative, A118 family,Phage portal protein, SPP1 Gp6-like [[Clostridium] sordellii]|uniref:phage portal protein n=1 Tax=Paraclostridium sordellii TaxID=1505 RepID=UPI0005422593|nr:phage portal protein [Paeniclostridium sordellii]CEK35449.1 bacteriophage portal protein, SPP1 Gp6-like protein,phage portal protein, putative, A118 family,Phage portal protein, SPP1 Gp6-like [[Clostridium] sordellii] [Paeniclostridium sordellii]